MAVADLAEAREGGDRGVVQLGGVVDQQDGVGAGADEAEGAAAMGVEDGLVSDLRAVGQSVERIERGEFVELLGEGAAGMLDDRIGGADQPAGAADMTDPGLAEVERPKKALSTGRSSIGGLRPRAIRIPELRRPWYTEVIRGTEV